MSEAGSETLEDEWQSISEIASACNTILESLSREGEALGALWEGARLGSYFLYHLLTWSLSSHRTAHPREWRCQGNPKV